MRNIVVFVLLSVATRNARATLEADNAGDLAMLCNIINMQGVQAAPTLDETDFGGEIETLEKMNMTTSDENWQKLFDGSKEANKWADKKATYGSEGKKTGWDDKWDKWAATKEKLTKPSEGRMWLDQNPQPTGEWAKKTAHININATLAKITEQLALYKAATEGAGKRIQEQVQQKISETIYGSWQKEFSGDAAKTLGDKSTYAAACQNSAGKSVANDILCLCCLAASGTSDECENTGTQCGWNRSPLTKLAAITAWCPQKKPEVITASSICQFIATVAAKIRVSKNVATIEHYLGKEPSTCSGATGNLCAKYTKYFGDSGDQKGVLGIPWVSKLEEAAQILEQIPMKAAEAQARAAQIETLIQTAKQHYKATQPTTEAEPAQAKTTSVPGHENKCKLKNATTEDCPSDHCDYDSKKRNANLNQEKKTKQKQDRKQLQIGLQGTKTSLIVKMTKQKKGKIVHL
ncbi:variant surface glycoprotein (VSG), putative [Trypanosoma brucei gambiense DAL972]|uniref:Variant surface glycoprotein (VSG), putative n=1 Tax=Trypanosoma brucei gambiense (strain MHOM/CI/86/DAL972) TaxID=679716 RepID=C9ZKT1_TRYB9|nr:variant surface glycoprotein (VSG), putative [Trypanosoma brucei gambiense DAL972]CBH09673.1 variant surface glycoprotein (VSG), putative [Trypanosoma brucei gambiense DAL972]|eukprot:XP_011771967.1 variant surface glycoprotein (VSG), putative [Trypanosoma brucei gambiense DAL972]